jgi:butyrate kinase
MKKYRIFVINPGSTSTKLSLHENEKCLFSTDVFHDSSVLKTFPTINDQLDYRMKVVGEFLKENEIDLKGIDAIVGRGGGCYSVVSGIYEVNEKLLEDTRNCAGGLYHSSNLGVQMAERLHREYGGICLMMDPPVVDELQDLARITGVKGIYRRAICHALNLKAAARKHAQNMGRRYDDLNLIVCHIDGGISITAHEKGRMIDGNDAGGGEGPFTPTRMGTMAVTDINRYLWEKSSEEIRSMCSQTGGLSSHFGTSNSDTIHKLMEDGNREAERVWKAMIYQTARYIGAMAAVLKGKVDGIVLTGGLCRFADVIDMIREHCEWIAPVSVYPGEYEHETMALGALRVLRGEEEMKQYPGKPAWEGFDGRSE